MDDQLAKSLECNICLDQLSEPKDLACHHTFCKECLDNLIQFNSDGTAVIQCPYKCEDVTLLPEDWTTESLPTNYVLQSVLDVVQTKSRVFQFLTRCHQPACTRSITRYCTMCNFRTCQICWTFHLCANKTYVSMRFINRTDKIEPFCELHSSRATYICKNCKYTFICAYCRARVHRRHDVSLLEEQAARSRKWLYTKISRAEESYLLSRTLQRKCKQTLREIRSCRDSLLFELKKRAEGELAESYEMLKNEANKILSKFNESVELFIRQISSTGLFLKSKAKQENLIRNYSVSVLESKEDFEIISTIPKIKSGLRNHCIDVIDFPKLFVVLKQRSNKSPFPQSIFGELSVDFATTNSKDICWNNASIFEFEIEMDEVLSSHKHITKDTFNTSAITFEWLNTTNESQFDNAIYDEEENQKVYSFAEVSEMVQNDDLESLHSVLSSQPDMLYAKNSSNQTLLHRAAYCGNGKALKLLLNKDSRYINEQNVLQYTPLMYASNNGHKSCVRVLLKYGAKPEIEELYGKTAYYIAKNSDIRRLIKRSTQKRDKREKSWRRKVFRSSKVNLLAY